MKVPMLADFYRRLPLEHLMKIGIDLTANRHAWMRIGKFPHHSGLCDGSIGFRPKNRCIWLSKGIKNNAPLKCHFGV
jgi:hypothetical protein